MDEKNASLSVKVEVPLAEAAGRIAEKTAESMLAAAGAVLSRLCLNTAEQVGLIASDFFAHQRAMRLVAFVDKLEARIAKSSNPAAMRAHPRLVHLAIQEASNIDEDDIQSMWAGLLSESANESEGTQDNLLYMNMLRQLTSQQARLFNFSCERCQKVKNKAGNIVPLGFYTSEEEVLKISGYSRLSTAVSAVDALIGIGLFNTATNLQPFDGRRLAIVPSSLALDLYVRCAGHNESVEEHFHHSPEWANFRPFIGNDVVIPHASIVSENDPDRHERV